jgi:mediator of RNA polymerase II transcription subunit 18
MQELFLTTSVGDGDNFRAVQILQGYCAMSSIPVLRRRLLWRGPSNRNTYKSIDPAFLLSLKPQQRLDFWRSLNEQFTRQAYVVTLLYDIKKDQFSKEGINTELETRPLVLFTFQ